MKYRDQHRAPNGQFVRPPRARGFYDPAQNALGELVDAVLDVPEQVLTPDTPQVPTLPKGPAKPYRLR